jgi:hypothetical protein
MCVFFIERHGHPSVGAGPVPARFGKRGAPCTGLKTRAVVCRPCRGLNPAFGQARKVGMQQAGCLRPAHDAPGPSAQTGPLCPPVMENAVRVARALRPVQLYAAPGGALSLGRFQARKGGIQQAGCLRPALYAPGPSAQTGRPRGPPLPKRMRFGLNFGWFTGRSTIRSRSPDASRACISW